jgi:type III secretory pathway lipoprotein EscJ
VFYSEIDLFNSVRVANIRRAISRTESEMIDSQIGVVIDRSQHTHIQRNSTFNKQAKRADSRMMTAMMLLIAYLIRLVVFVLFRNPIAHSQFFGEIRFRPTAAIFVRLEYVRHFLLA